MIIRAINFMLIGILFGVGVFSYAFSDSYGKLAEKYISKTKSLEKKIALQSVDSSTDTKSPMFLFDIKLEMDSTKIVETDTLSARVLFTNFGTVNTPVAMNFTITDVLGNKVNQEADVVTVQTERIHVKEFKDFKPKSGLYTLTLETVYGNNVRDEFRQDFKVKRNKFLGIF